MVSTTMIVYVVEILWAVSSAAVFAGILYFNRRVLWYLRGNEELSLTKVFINEKSPRLFKVFSVGMLVFGASMIIGIMALPYNDFVYHYVTKLASSFMFLTWLYFFWNLSTLMQHD